MFADRSEGAMTALVDAVVAEVIIPEEWAKCSMIQRQQIKEQLLPVIASTVDAVDAEPYQPKRNDAVATWIKAERDELDRTKGTLHGWHVLDNLLDDYRERADTGRGLAEEADEDVI